MWLIQTATATTHKTTKTTSTPIKKQQQQQHQKLCCGKFKLQQRQHLKMTTTTTPKTAIGTTTKLLKQQQQQLPEGFRKNKTQSVRVLSTYRFYPEYKKKKCNKTQCCSYIDRVKITVFFKGHVI